MNRIGHAVCPRTLKHAGPVRTPVQPRLERTGFSGASGFSGAARLNAGARRSPGALISNANPLMLPGSTFLNRVQSLLVRGIATVVAGVSGAARAVWTGIQQAGQAIGNAASRVGSAVSNVASKVVSAVSNVASKVASAVSNAAAQVGNAVSNLWRSIFG